MRLLAEPKAAWAGGMTAAFFAISRTLMRVSNVRRARSRPFVWGELVVIAKTRGGREVEVWDTGCAEKPETAPLPTRAGCHPEAWVCTSDLLTTHRYVALL